jgi:glutamyl-tRNA synthetase
MTNTSPVRVRFAPSPTGLLHIGGVRTALYNYLYAQKNQGKFLLRLEDTDRERYVAEGVDQIIAGLDWLGLVPDEGVWIHEETGEYGPYLQSERLGHYQQYADELVRAGKAYYSAITPEAYVKLREDAIAAKQPFVYRQDMEPAGEHGTNNLPIRLKVSAGKTHWRDEVRGEFETNNELIDDFVIIKADGYPTYNFANVVDDHLMKISHVVRGDEFISSTAKHALIYDYFGWDRPKWVHAPAILGPDGKKKLSKRDGDVDVLEYKSKGYLPEALVNFLAALGWNDGTTQEIYTRDELIQAFKLERIQKSPAKFDPERLLWLNGLYIRNLSLSELDERAQSFWSAEAREASPETRQAALGLVQERLKLLSELPELTDFFFTDPKLKTELLTNKASAAEAQERLAAVSTALEAAEFNHDGLESALRGLAEKLELKAGDLFSLIRVAVTGKTAAPGLFETLAVLGQNTVLRRLAAAEKLVKS